MPGAAGPRRARRIAPVLALAVVAELAVAGVAVAQRTGPAAPPAAAVRGAPLPPRAVAEAATTGRPEGQAREQVQALLDERARAVLARDRPAFLAGVDRGDPAFAARQAALFDALTQVPLSAWSYALEPGSDGPPGDRWTVRAVLRSGLAGVDDDPAKSRQVLALSRRDGRWLLAGDDGSERALWDDGPVVAVRGQRSLVLAHPATAVDLARLAADVDAAVPRVTARWGSGWSQRVAVLVPRDAAELARLVPGVDLRQAAALAVAGPVRGGSALGADRVLVDPAALAQLGPLGRQVVLTHEVTHVASRAATGPLTPSWLAEGLADWVAYDGTGVPVGQAAAELAAQVRARGLPAALPTDAQLTGGAPDLPAAYEQAWLAVRLLAQEHGPGAVLALYREVGAATGDPARALDDALRRRTGQGTAALTARWRRSLAEQLS